MDQNRICLMYIYCIILVDNLMRYCRILKYLIFM
jgi:hypothetical protein